MSGLGLRGYRLAQAQAHAQRDGVCYIPPSDQGGVTMRPYPVFAFAAVLALAGCGQPTETQQTEAPETAAEPIQQEQAAAPSEEDLTPASAEEIEALGEGIQSGLTRTGDDCDTSRRGQVLLSVAGQADDGFRVILMCGNTVVARCGAYVSNDPATARCDDGPNPQPPGARRCIVGPRNNNSAAAQPQFSCPEL